MAVTEGTLLWLLVLTLKDEAKIEAAFDFLTYLLANDGCGI